MTEKTTSLPIESWHLDAALVGTAEHAICLTGMGRSGTTLLGTIVNSLQGVEYGFEPPMLVSLFHRMDLIPREIWERLYSEYLFEELLLGALSGRRLNFQNSDWSCIFKAKPIPEVAARFEESSRKRDIYEAAIEATIAYKVPNITHRLDELVARYPKTRTAITLRDPDEVARSVMQRSWFRGEDISYRLCGHLRASEGRHVPACLVGISEADWLALDEEERCHACYVGTYEVVMNSKYPMIDYAKLLEQPTATIRALSDLWGLKWGEMTPGLVDNIREPKHSIPKTAGAGYWRQRALDLYATYRKNSI